MKKKCPICRKEKDSSNFYKSPKRYDGLRAYCKDCTKIKQRANKKYFRDYQRKIRGNNLGINDSTRDWNKRNIKAADKTEYARKYWQERYHNDEDFNKKVTQANKNYKSKNKIKTSARNILNAAVKKGVIKREPCVVCGNKRTHGHHEDYLKPLEVIWLCAKHHNGEHRKK